MIREFAPEIKNRMPEVRDRWIAHNHKCAPADRLQAERGVMEAYRTVGLPPPKIVWCGSPLSAEIAREYVLVFYKQPKFRERRDRLRLKVGELMWQSAMEIVRRSICSEDRTGILNTVGANVGSMIKYRVAEMVSERIAYNVSCDLLKDVNENITQMVENADIYSRLENILENICEAPDRYPDTICQGETISPALAKYEFLNLIDGLQNLTKELNSLSMIAQSAGWYWAYEKICWICERPESIRLDDQFRIHNLTGPAISFPDGWKIYASHGVILPDWVIETSEKITPSKIDDQRNSEIRRIMIEMFGVEKYLKQGGGRKVASDSYGRLWRKALKNDNPIVIVELLNSTPEKDGSLSVKKAIAAFGAEAKVNHDGMMMRLREVPDGLRFKSYFLRVPPNCASPREAVAWTFHKTEDEYDLETQS